MKIEDRMKTRERLKKIRQSKSWVERRALAKDHLPGTRFDGIIHHWMDTLYSMEEGGIRPVKRASYFSKDTGRIDIAGMNHDHMAAMGEDFARAFKKGNSDYFREWADAVDAWHNHKPYADKIRLAIIDFCIPPTGVFSVRKILARLKERKIDVTDSTPRIVRRICAELKIRTDRKPGAPKKADTKAIKSPR